jgi:cytochrome P450/NADPH-cytochrome P450 reductase
MAKSCQLIPQPPPKPFLGNVTDIDPKNVTHSLTRLAEKYGPIYRLKFPHNNLVVLSTWEGVNEACDDERFEKSIEGDLDVGLPQQFLFLFILLLISRQELRAAVNDGLFTVRIPVSYKLSA